MPYIPVKKRKKEPLFTILTFELVKKPSLFNQDSELVCFKSPSLDRKKVRRKCQKCGEDLKPIRWFNCVRCVDSTEENLVIGYDSVSGLSDTWYADLNGKDNSLEPKKEETEK